MTPRQHILTRAALLVLTAAWITGCASSAARPDADAQTPAEGKIRITRLDDLPQHTYPVESVPSQMVTSRGRMLQLADKVRADIRADMATYDVTDKTTLQRWHGTLLTIDLLEGNWDAALDRVATLRDLEDKPGPKLTTGMTTKAMIAARRQADPQRDDAAYRRIYQQTLARTVDLLPWDLVGDEIENAKGRLQIFSENLLIGSIQARVDNKVAETGELNADEAASLLSIHTMLTQRLPLKDETLAVYQNYLTAHAVEKPDIWPNRALTLDPAMDLDPVLVAAWDSGTDTAIFRDRLWTNPAEQLNDQDDDGNGYVDDVHGIAYDIDARRATGLLCPLGDAADRITHVMKYMKGLMDLQANIASPEADELRAHLAGLEPAQVNGFLEDLGLAGNYSHGTHVAGIMLRDNPFARLLVARLSYDHRTKPIARTEDWGRRDAAKCRDTVEYFKQHGVRVVNMSWGEALEDAEDSLEANGIGENAEERRAIARRVFDLQKQGLYEAIKNAPDVLFICAAGNADNDVEFDDYIPSSFDLPNLLTVGAVDQAGDATSFTSFGASVRIYASGFEVASYVPGGDTMKMSGTSMASPNVANLAGKLIAMDPNLSPEEVIALILDGADWKESGGARYRLLNPRQSAELLKNRQG